MKSSSERRLRKGEMNSIFLAAGIWPFSKAADAITSKVIFHASTLGIPERQQLGVASLSPAGFSLDLAGKGEAKPLKLSVPFSRIVNLRVFQKKTYSSVFYVVQVEYKDEADKPCMVACEIRVFLRRGQALVALQRWKELYEALKS